MLNSTLKTRKKQTARGSRGRNIGTIVDDRLIKRVAGTKHMLRSPRGWAIDRELLVRAKEAGVTTVIIFDYKNHITYTAPLNRFFKDGEYIDRGHGVQKCLTLEYWTVSYG